MDTLDYSANLINNLTALRNQNVVHDDTEAALAENQRQFNANLALQAHEFQTNQDFMNKQHSEQMDFANRNLNSNIEIANRNFDLQQEAYEKNLELQNRQFNYQKELNQTQMEREDTAIQRAVADYKAAGFSPLAAIGTTGAASSPLSSAGASSVQAAQYDVSGINNASGQYADFAKQYAALVYNARQDYSNRRSELSEKHNADILASRITLAKMRQDMRLGYANLANQVFNSAVNARNARAQYDYIQEQKSYLEDKHSWESKHGYRGESFGQALVALANQIKESDTFKKIAGELGVSINTLNNAIENWTKKRNEPITVSLQSDLSTGDVKLLNDKSKEIYGKSFDELDPSQWVRVVDEVTPNNEKLSTKIKNWVKEHLF